MDSTDTKSILDTAIRFHGHQCPGLAMGLRVSLVALMLTGCTFGKGNLIFKDYGKYVYTFMNRENQRAIRISIKKEAVITDKHHLDLFAKVKEGTATPAEMAEFKRLHIEKSNVLLDLPEADLLTIEEVTPEPLPMAHIHESVCCDRCGESVMETRIRLLGGAPHCIPCFEELMG